MKVVFLQDVPGVGYAGDVKNVADGHARNYLLPKGLVVAATAEELKRVEARKRAAEKLRQQQMKEAQGAAAVMGDVSLVFAKRVGSKGAMYGSVSGTAIAQELKRLGHVVEKTMIRLPEPIRQLGVHEVEIELAKGVVARIKVNVEAAKDEGPAGEVAEATESAETD